MQKRSVKGFATAFARVSSLMLMCFFLSAVSKAQTVYYINENFSTASGSTPPAGWVNNIIAGSVVFDTWRFNNPGGRFTSAPISSPFAVFDSDNLSSGGGAENVALESPAFNTTGATNVHIHWDQYFNGIFNSTDSIVVEAFDGTTWNKVYASTSSSSITNSPDIDATCVIANKATAKVRFRFVGNYSWWWIIDNIQVYRTSPISFIKEPFTTASGTTPPAGWAVNKIAGAVGSDIWRFDNPKPRTFSAPIAGNFGIFDSDFMGTGVTENVALESPVVNTTGITKVYLKWDQNFNGIVNANDSITAEVFNGTTWNAVYVYKGAAAITNSQDIDVSAFAANLSSVKVRFRFAGNYSWWWIVDNVELYNATPIANFCVNGGAQCLSGNSFTFTNNSAVASGSLTYSWNFGDATTSTSATPTKTYTSAGLYTVTLTVTSNNGLSSTTTAQALVKASPTPTFTGTLAANICTNASTTYATQTSQTNYTWSVPGTAGVDYTITSGGIGTTNSTVTLQWLTTGSKTVTVNYTNSVGCPGGTAASRTTTVNARPVVTFTTAPGATSCSNVDITYTTQSGQSNYVWVVPGVLNTDYTITSGGTGTGSNTVTLKWLTTGSKTVTVNYSNAAGCSQLAATSNTTTVNATPVPTYVPAVPTVSCQSTNVIYRTQVGQSNYIWTIPGISGVDYNITAGSTATSSNTVTLQWLNQGNKTVTINYTSAGGCPGLSPASATTLIDIPTVTFTTSPGANTCDKTDVTYTTQSGQSNYTWSVPGVSGVDYSVTSGGIGTTSNTVTLKWLITGSKTVTVNYNNASGCPGLTPASNTTTVNASPTVTFSTAPGATICSSTDVTYTTQAGQSNYAWSVPGVLSTDYTITSGGTGSTSNTVTLKWLTSGSKTVTVNYTNASSCPGLTAATNTTTVNLRPAVTFTVAPGVNSCDQTDITYTTQSGQTLYTWSVPGTLGVDYSITSGGIGLTSNTVTLKWLTAGSKTVTVNYTDANGCNALTAASNTTTVNASPVVTFTVAPGATVCSSTNVTYTTQSAQTNYIWSVPGTAGVDYTITSGGIGTTSNTVTLQWLTTGNKTVTVNYTTTVGCPGLVAASNTTTVNARPVVTFTASPGASSCTGASITYTTQAGQTNYTWTVPGTAGIDYTITSGGIGTGSNTVTLQWLTAGSKTVTVNYTNASNCTGLAAASSTTTANQTPTVNAVSNQTICATQNTAAVTFSSSVAGSTFAWTNNTTSIGLAASGTGNIASFVAANATTSPVTATISVTATANSCTGPATNFNITVNNYISTQPSSSVVCFGSGTSFTVGTVGSVTYQWQENRGTGWNNAQNNNGVIYTGATTATLSLTALPPMFNGFQYRCVVTGACSVISNIATLTVNTQPAITSQPANLPLQCPGNTIFYTVGATGFNLTYQWQEFTGTSWNNINNGGIYQNATTATLTLNGVATAMSGWQYRCVVSGGCAPSPATSNVVTLGVGIPPSITQQPTSVTKCLGSNHTFVTIGNGSNAVYQWQLSTDGGTTWNNVTNGGVYSGATASQLNITGMTQTMSGYQYRCVVTGTCPTAATSNAVTLTVNPPAAISIQPVASTVCEGGTTAFAVGATGTATLTYQWQVNFGSGFVNVNPNLPYFNNSNSTTSTLTVSNIPVLLNGTQFRCIVSSTTCPANVTSSAVALTVNTKPQITVQPANKVTCAGSNTVFTITGTGTGLTYQWQENNGSGFVNLANVAPYSGVTTNTFTITSTQLPLNNNQYRCIISGTCTPSVTSNAASLTVNSLPFISAQPVSVNLCPGVNTFFQIAATGTAITYQWQVNPGTGYVNLTNTPPYNGVTTNRLDITGVTNSMNNYQYQCVVTGACPQAVSNAAALVVKNPVVILSQTKKDSVCEGESVSMNVTTFGSALQYQWQVKRPGAPAYADLVNLPPYYGTTTDNISITQTADTMNGFVFRCKVYETVACNTAVYSDTIPMIINSVPPAVGSGTAINEGLPATFSISGIPGTAIFQWQENTNNGAGFTNLVDGIDYNGVSTPVLTVVSVKAIQNNYTYRCVLNNYCATSVASRPAVLNVIPASGVAKTAFADNGIVVYPNPVSGNELFIKTTRQLSGNVHIRIMDVVGKQIYSKDATLLKGQTSVDVSGFVPGTYNITITDDINHLSAAIQFTRLQ
jgi:hypothetical protein